MTVKCIYDTIKIIGQAMYLENGAHKLCSSYNKKEGRSKNMKTVVSYLLVGSMILSSFSAIYSVIAFAGQAKKTEIEVRDGFWKFLIDRMLFFSYNNCIEKWR